MLLTVHISHYWCSKYNTIDNIIILKDIDFGFNGFDTTFSKKLIEFNFIILSLPAKFTLYKTFFTMTRFHWFFMEEKISRHSDISR